MQKRTHSLIESVGNTAVGFVLSVLTWEFIVKPVWNIHTSFAENLQITAVFTVISIARGYVLRRVGNYFTVQQKQKEDTHDASDRVHG